MIYILRHAKIIIIITRVFYFITIMLFVSNTIPIDLSVIYFNNIKSVIYCIIIVVILVVNTGAST
jgi:hypothetical protein